jgi:hypothetical protein
MSWISRPAVLAALACVAGCGAPPAPVAPPAAAPPAPARTAVPLPKPPVSQGYVDPGGMWMPGQMRMQARTLRKLGLAFDPAKLDDPLAYPLGAVVSLGGCSASFVSPDGLVITNHHCVTGALSYNSKPGQDLLKNGYLAKDRASEKWIGPTGRVFVTQSFKDVTDQVRTGLEGLLDDRERWRTIERREKALVADCEKGRPSVRCETASYFGGAQYMLITRLAIKDVRLVYAPASGIGNFGGEVDNWRWPRHAGEFAFYRAYVGKDGKPAEHSADNVPYKPKQFLKIADKPLRTGSLVFVAGYPGRTYRNKTAAELHEAVDWWYPRRIRLCTDYIAVMTGIGKQDEDARLKGTPLRRGLSNVLTYTRGALAGLTKGGAAAKKDQREKELEQWMQADPKRRAAYGDVLSRMHMVFAKREKTRDGDAALDEMTWSSKLLDAALTIVHNAEERQKPDAEREGGYQERDQEDLIQAQQALEKRYSEKLDRALLVESALRAAQLPAKDEKPLLTPLLGRQKPTNEHIRVAVEKLYEGTKLGDTPTRVKLMKSAKLSTLRRSRDPRIRLALRLRPLQKAEKDRADARRGALSMLRPPYIKALRDSTPHPLAPDANSTLRITYGTVRGYSPKPGAPVYLPFTTAAGVVKKNTGKDPFDAPERLIDAIKQGKFDGYENPELGTLPVDFLTDTDITGGNSGSPTLDAQGHLVGLAFDGNYEAMASDWLFMPDITRAIHVDIRYVLWIMARVDHADWLLDEMGVRHGAK